LARSNAWIAEQLRHVANLLAAQGTDPLRAAAYRHAQTHLWRRMLMRAIRAETGGRYLRNSERDEDTPPP
jgi:hypothetical protein